jgi:hypothetical protein
MKKILYIMTVSILMFFGTSAVFAQGYDVLFTVEGPLDGSADPSPLYEGHIYRQLNGSLPAIAPGGSQTELLNGFYVDAATEVGLDGFDVITIRENLGRNEVEMCYWTSEIDFVAFGGNPNPPPPGLEYIKHGDIIAKMNPGGPIPYGYYIQNQTLRAPFDFYDASETEVIPATEDIGLDALDVEGVDETLYIMLSESTGAGERALGSFGYETPDMYTPEFADFNIMGASEFWVFWSFETTNEVLTLGPSHNIFNGYTSTLLPVFTPISADDLLCTVFTSGGPSWGYLVRTGRDFLPVTSPQIESLFEGINPPDINNVGLDAVDLPNIMDMDLDLGPNGSDEMDETGLMGDPDVDSRILFSTSLDDAVPSTPTFMNGDVLSLQTTSGLANDIFEGVMIDNRVPPGQPLSNDILSGGLGVDVGLDGLDIIAPGTGLPVREWKKY